MGSPLDTPILPLLKVVFESILEVFLLCLAGYILARKGVLDKKTQKQLNRVNVSLFTPSLLFSKVAFFLSPAKLKELWIIPIFFTVTTVASMAVAYVLGVTFRLKRSQRSFAIAAAMFMNSNSLPIALMQSLVITVPGLKWGDDDNKDAMVGRALTYLVLHSTMGMVLRWSYGVRLLAQADPEPVEMRDTNEATPLLEPDETAFPPSAEEEQIHRHEYPEQRQTSTSSSTQVSGKSTPEITVARPNDHLKPDAAYQPKDRAADDTTSAEYDSATIDDDDSDELLIGRPVTEPTSSRFQSRMRQTKTKFRKGWKKLNDFMTAPLWAALASLIVALIQPLQHIMNEHLVPVKGALNSAGNCSIPITLVVLGAYFYTPPDPESNKRKLPTHSSDGGLRSVPSQVSLAGHMKNMFARAKRSQGIRTLMNASGDEGKRPGETKTVFIAVLARMVITPLVLLPAMALSAKFDWQRVLEDPVFVVSNVLLISSPPALTLAQITQAASGDAFERLISRTIFWAYCVVTPPATIIFVVVGLLLSKL
ncbi:hypothetical protein GLOTRDRAFT_117738 [Gloeophyllum trabeum ATCC 11539]|uniref:Auxin efflux carrier n=1 Tax=Gloeophyllum trabeum (strain ATCC 11539 / FP-39264 / Madison 617) TaxID=670483 RepID=S7RDT5_GLOTA|nr:uncharacterized protein GLOTRDRAFT_117738 [Gloeophyllum trabeum ATCC 11539]EPQ52375.1 hypothetical protein GLOTRDRAFT_117738 [Gloeophyllum trabeum ATCC 11539]